MIFLKLIKTVVKKLSPQLIVIISLLLLNGVPVYSQIKVGVSFPQEQYLAYEPLVAVVKISNVSGQKINFSNDEKWLDFAIETKTGRIIPKKDDPPMPEPFSVESGEMAVVRVNLEPFYNATQPDRYSVVATVFIKEWNKHFVSDAAVFDIVTGIKIWEKEFGVPPEDSKESPAPEVRKYALLMANFKNQLRLYFRLSNVTEDKVYKMFFLGNLTSIGKPEANLDKFNNLHILHQYSGKSFKYSVISPDGRLFLRETHDYTDSRPRLWLDKDGRIYVKGGARRVANDDIPGAFVK